MPYSELTVEKDLDRICFVINSKHNNKGETVVDCVWTKEYGMMDYFVEQYTYRWCSDFMIKTRVGELTKDLEEKIIKWMSNKEMINHIDTASKNFKDFC